MAAGIAAKLKERIEDKEDTFGAGVAKLRAMEEFATDKASKIIELGISTANKEQERGDYDSKEYCMNVPVKMADLKNDKEK